MKITGTDGKEYTIESRADLDGAYLRGANLYRAYLYRAYLIRTDLREANLSDADLSGAIWSDETVFPEGFEIPDELQG
jgi:uncharacterized protein YjbI with pentapeptide repeats